MQKPNEGKQGKPREHYLSRQTEAYVKVGLLENHRQGGDCDYGEQKAVKMVEGPKNYYCGKGNKGKSMKLKTHDHCSGSGENHSRHKTYPPA